MSRALYVRDIPPRLSTTPRPLLEEAPVSKRLPWYVYTLAVLSVLMLIVSFGADAIRARAAETPASKPAIAKSHKPAKPWMVYRSGKTAAKKRAKHDYTRAEVKTVIRWVARKRHMSKCDVADLMVLARRESDYDNRCVTGSYRGVMQVSGHHGWIFDPYWNVGVAIGQMKRTYGSVHKARLHSDRTGWW